jgi:hypothetical protein
MPPLQLLSNPKLPSFWPNTWSRFGEIDIEAQLLSEDFWEIYIKNENSPI